MPSTYGLLMIAFKRFVCSLAVCAAFLAAYQPQAQAEPRRIVGFGDSLMAGYGLDAGLGFPERLQSALKARGHDVVIANAGVSGDTTSGGLSRLDWSVPDGSEIVILELGANDMLRGVDPALTRRNLDAMIAKLKQRGVTVLLAGMRAAPNLGASYATTFDAIYPELAKQYGLTLYPFFLDGVAGDSVMTQPDGLHPTAAGIDRMVARFLPVIEGVLNKTKAPS